MNTIKISQHAALKYLPTKCVRNHLVLLQPVCKGNEKRTQTTYHEKYKNVKAKVCFMMLISLHSLQCSSQLLDCKLDGFCLLLIYALK